MKRSMWVLVGLALVFAIAQIGVATGFSRSRPAEAGSHTAPPQKISAEGRLVAYPGSEVTVGTDVTGTIDRLNVYEKQHVKKGDVIVVIRADDTRAALGQAGARVGEADADIRLYELERDRAQTLWQTAVGSKQAWERAERDLDAARARRSSAVAEVRRLEATLAKAIIRSPISGVVTARFVQPGETISTGNPIVSIADLNRTRVEAEVDEFDAGRVALGANAIVTAEGYDGSWRGSVEEIPDAVTTRRLKPQDTSKPVDTRVLLVKVALSERTSLKLSQRVEIEFSTK